MKRTPSGSKKIVRRVLHLRVHLPACGFIAAYVGFEVGIGPPRVRRQSVVDAALRSNLAPWHLAGGHAHRARPRRACFWVRHLMPDVEVVEERHETALGSEGPAGVRAVLQRRRVEQAKFVKRPLVRRTLMLGTLPTAGRPRSVLLRDLGPLPGTSLRHHRVEPGAGGLLVFGTDTPITPAEFSVPGSAINDRARGLCGRRGRADQRRPSP